MSQPSQTGDRIKVALCTREYPPEVYGGAGVHVKYLAKELSQHVDLTMHCQGADRPTAVAHRPWDRLKNANPALQTICTGLSTGALIFPGRLVTFPAGPANMRNQISGVDGGGCCGLKPSHPPLRARGDGRRQAAVR